ncbi:DNA-directed RNA polymerase subunit alpha C-terminal domain-containing protein [Nostoc sp. CALU 1950]|uniref:DNA-directed RNA polymerase subunit alpha C-terminal domain-containing protein n=1 Tax=Nostoc sp. CALU 1950 TaxID=3104321 RepID=UPI003EB90C3F
MSYELIVQILGRSPQGFTPFEILDHLLALPHYQGRSRSSIFAELLFVLQSLRDSQEVAHVSPRWVLVETQEKTSEELGDQSTEQNLTELTLAIEQEAYPVVDISLDCANPVMTVEKPKETNNVNNTAFDFPIEILNLSKRVFHSLKRARINTVAELQSYSDEYLLTIDGFGQTSLDNVKSVLAIFQPTPYSRATQELSLQPEWLKLCLLQIPTICLSISPHLHQFISKYSTVAHLIDAFEAGDIIVQYPHEYGEIRVLITPFQLLRDASLDYVNWLTSLPKVTLIQVLTKYQWTPNILKELSAREILSSIASDAREITCQAIIFGRIPSKSFITIAEEIDDWFDDLNDQEKIVLKQQLGLQNGKRRNLADIGRVIGLSRERVRQIEGKAKNKLNDINKKSILLQFRRVSIEALHSAGCINNLQEWCEDIAQIYPAGEIHLPSFILWVMDFIPEIHSIQILEKQFFYIAPFTNQIFENLEDQLTEFWTEQRFSDRSQLHQIILPLLPEDILNSEQVADTLINTCCNEQLPGIFSAIQWDLADYAYYVISEAGKALHFSEIGQLLKQLKPDWKADNIERAAQSLVDRHPEIIRSGSGIYGLREWGTMEYGHFREVLLDYLSKQSLPVDAEDIYTDLSQSYAVTQPTVTMTLSFHPNLFKKIGRSNLYGVPGRFYELPEQNLINLLVAKLKASPVTLSDLEQDIDLCKYDAKTIYLYLNVSPLFCQTASNKEKKFGLSIEGKRQYQPGEASKIIRDIFNQIREPLHAKDFLQFLGNFYAYPPGESAFWRTLSEAQDYINIAEAIFIPRNWMSDETLNPILEDLDTELFREIVLFTLGSKRQQPTSETLFNWLNFCYRNRFFYRGSLIYAQVNLGELSDKKAQAVRQIGKVCQRNGDTSVLAIGQDANSEEVDRSLRLDLEDLQQQAQSVQRTLSKGLASVQDGKYRVRYVGVGVEVYITKYGGTDNPCARVLQVLVNSEPYDPSRHNPIPTNTATLDQRREALQKLYEAKLTAYAQVDSYLQVAIGQRPSWGGVGYRNLEPITEQATEDVA